MREAEPARACVYLHSYDYEYIHAYTMYFLQIKIMLNQFRDNQICPWHYVAVNKSHKSNLVEMNRTHNTEQKQHTSSALA